jgi:tetratricopeptide (TPR) repeat protein
MKKLIILIALVFTCILAFAQDKDKAFKYFKTGQYALAAKEFETALPELKNYYGENDTTVYAKFIFYTALSFYYDKRFDIAINYLIKGKEIYELKKVQDNPNYIYFLEYLIIIYKDNGAYQKAILMLEEALQKFEKSHSKYSSNYAYLLGGLGFLYFEIGQFENSLPLILEALEIIEKVWGKEHPLYATSLNNLAGLYHDIGEYENALPLYLEALEIIEKVWGKEHPDYATSLNNLAALYSEMGQYENALPYYLEALEIREKELGKEHPDYGMSLNNLALLYHRMGEYEKALPLYLEALEIREKVLGKEHPDFATALNNLALLYQDMGKYENALPLYLEALEIREKVLGKDHPDYASSLNNLALLYHRMGEYEKALPLYLEAFEIQEKALGKEHPSSIPNISNLAMLHQDMGQYEKALPLSLEILEIREQKLGKEHPDYARSVNNLAMLYYRMGEYENALPLYLEALEIQKKALGKEHPEYMTSLSNLAMLYQDIGQYEKALPLFLESLEIREQKLGKDHPDYAISLNNLAMLYYRMGEYENALNLYLEALEIQEKALGKEHPASITNMSNIAMLYLDMGQYEKALPLLLEILEIREQKLGKEHPDYATSLNNLAMMYRRMGEYENALPLYLKALEINEKVLGKEHSASITNMSNLAILYQSMGQYKKALPLLLESLEISEQKLGKEHLAYVMSLHDLALLYSKMGQYKKSLPLYLEALEINQKLLGKEHPNQATYLFNLARLYSKMGFYEKALPFIQQSIENRLFNISQNFGFLSENEKIQYLATMSYEFDIFKSFFKDYSPENPSVAADSWNLELATKGMILQSGIQMRQAIQNSGDEKAIIKYDEWLVAKASLVKQYSLPITQRSGNLKELELQAEKLESELSRLSNTFQQAQTIGSITWKDVQQRLGENEVAIEFSSFPYHNGKQWTDSILYTANVLRPGDEYPHLVYLCEQRQLDSLLYRQKNTEPDFIAGLYRGVEPVETSTPSNGQRLYELIWSPITQLLPEGATVYFASAGNHHQIAHAAIPEDENTLLSDKYNLVQLSTTAALLHADDQNISLTGEIVLFGGIQYTMNGEELLAMSAQNHDINKIVAQRGIPTDIDRGTETWDYLSGTLTEVETIGKQAATQGMEVTSYTGKEALEERFKELSGKNSPTVVHIATHGFFFPDPQKEPQRDGFMMMDQDKQVFRASDNPLNRAGLLFAGANLKWQGDTIPEGVDDGILTAWEATNITLSNTQLVALSACETGLGEVRGSEGVFGLQRAFKAAGAEYIMMSLWKVPDTETAEFMEYFYSQLFGGESIIDSFHATQHYMKDRYPGEPEKWAGFVLVR